MNLKQLEYFVSVASTCNMRVSAEELHVSESNLSQTIKALEEEYNTKFFRRDGRGLVLLPAGAFLAQEARLLLSEFNKLQGNIREFNNEFMDHLSIGFDTSSVAKKIFNGFHVNHPNIILEPSYKSWTSGENILTSLPNKDFYLTSLPIGSKNYKFVPLPQMGTYLMMSEKHPLSSKKELSLCDLENETFIVPPQNSNIRQIHELFFKLAKINPYRIVEGEILHHFILLTTEPCLEIISEQAYITTYQNTDISRKLDIKFVPLTDSFCHMGTYLNYHSSRPLSAVDSLFMEYCEYFFHYLHDNHNYPTDCENFPLAGKRRDNIAEEAVNADNGNKKIISYYAY